MISLYNNNDDEDDNDDDVDVDANTVIMMVLEELVEGPALDLTWLDWQHKSSAISISSYISYPHRQTDQSERNVLCLQTPNRCYCLHCLKVYLLLWIFQHKHNGLKASFATSNYWLNCVQNILYFYVNVYMYACVCLWHFHNWTPFNPAKMMTAYREKGVKKWWQTSTRLVNRPTDDQPDIWPCIMKEVCGASQLIVILISSFMSWFEFRETISGYRIRGSVKLTADEFHSTKFIEKSKNCVDSSFILKCRLKVFRWTSSQSSQSSQLVS